jgi:hypothetical protein
VLKEFINMNSAKDVILAVQKNNSHGGYGLQKECEESIGYILNNMVKSKLPHTTADVKNDHEANIYREEGKYVTKIYLLLIFLFWVDTENYVIFKISLKEIIFITNII